MPPLVSLARLTKITPRCQPRLHACSGNSPLNGCYSQLELWKLQRFIHLDIQSS
jgi:hypothetical protein